MHKCLLCQQSLAVSLSFIDVLCFTPPIPDVLCSSCKQLFVPYVQEPTDCRGCHRKRSGTFSFEMNPSQKDGHYCHDCWRWLERYPKDYVNHHYLYAYNEAFKEWLHAYKYIGDYRLAYAMRTALRAFAARYSDYLWLVLASSPRSLARRQFHQTAMLLDLADIPYGHPFAYIGDGFQQAKKDRQERLNLGRVFALEEEIEGLNEAAGVILFDDLYTTGATLMRAKELVLPLCQEKGIECISLSLARHSK